MSKNRHRKNNKPRKEPTVSHPQQAPQAPQQAAPPRVVTRDPSEEVPTLLHEMEGWFGQLKRSTAGFNTLRSALASATGQTPEGERKKALPILEFNASLVGAENREAVKCAVDLKKVDPQYVPHVLIPLINAHAGELLEAVDEIAERVALLKPILTTMAGVGQAQPNAA